MGKFSLCDDASNVIRFYRTIDCGSSRFRWSVSWVGYFRTSLFLDFATGGVLLKDKVSSGFLSALAGFLRQRNYFVPKICFLHGYQNPLEGLKSIFSLFPVFRVLIMGALMLFVINGPMGCSDEWLNNFLANVPRELGMVLGF